MDAKTLYPLSLLQPAIPLGPCLYRGNDVIEVVVTRLDVGRGAVRASAALLSDAERQRASRFAFDRDRRRFTVARAWLRRPLSARLGVRPIELVYGAHGKPALARRFADSDPRFNVSRTDDVAVYAFAPRREIGVDVEAIRVIRDAGGDARPRGERRRLRRRHRASGRDATHISFAPGSRWSGIQFYVAVCEGVGKLQNPRSEGTWL